MVSTLYLIKKMPHANFLFSKSNFQLAFHIVYKERNNIMTSSVTLTAYFIYSRAAPGEQHVVERFSDGFSQIYMTTTRRAIVATVDGRGSAFKGV